MENSPFNKEEFITIFVAQFYANYYSDNFRRMESYRIDAIIARLPSDAKFLAECAWKRFEAEFLEKEVAKYKPHDTIKPW